MKVVILAEVPEIVREIVENEGHAIVAETDSLARLAILLAEHRPHFVFAEAGPCVGEAVAKLAEVFTTTRFVLLGFERGKTWAKSIRKALRKPRLNGPRNTKMPDQQQVIFDPRYLGFCKSKLKRPTDENEQEADSQTARLLWMLRAARVVRPRAEHYRDATNQTLAFEWQEIIYRTLHGSFKSSAYARDLLGRSAGFLAHFVPGLDLDGLPAPVDAPPTIRFLHYSAPHDMRYAIFGLALFGFDEELGRHLYKAAQWRFEPENSKNVVTDALMLTGLAFTLHRIGWAQLTAVSWLLDPDTPDRLEEDRARSLHRALQTFSDFWGMRRVIDDPVRLATTLALLHGATPGPPLPKELQIPNYADFLRATAEVTNPNPKKP